MTKEIKNIKRTTILRMSIIFKTLGMILLIALIMYSVMAVITHFSLNYETDGYQFFQSLSYIFNIETAIFRFFAAFMLLNMGWIFLAVSINFIQKQFIK